MRFLSHLETEPTTQARLTGLNHSHLSFHLFGTIIDESMRMTTHKSHHTLRQGAAIMPESHRVLIVDDEPALRFAYRKLLESELFAFDISDNVKDAVLLIQSKTYFAVISDVRFAGSGNEDGLNLVSVVRQKQPESKTILVTGYGSDTLKNSARKLGVSHYFEKPVQPALILTLLRALHSSAHEQEIT
ncbi:MAG: response regulator [Proteobacteria bacterium]|nr:response regulator [Pseudomonadota bacterium]